MSLHVYPVKQSSGKTKISILFLSASLIFSLIKLRLLFTLPISTLYVAHPTLTKPRLLFLLVLI